MTGKSRIAPKFPCHLFFEWSLINNTELKDISTRIICMAILIWLKNYDKIKNTYVPGLFDKPSLFTKIKLKRPLSTGNHFNIYLRLECWENRGSRQNFHGIPFFKRSYINKPGSCNIPIFIPNVLCINHENYAKKWLTIKKRLNNLRYLNKSYLKNLLRQEMLVLLPFFIVFFSAIPKRKQTKELAHKRKGNK